MSGEIRAEDEKGVDMILIEWKDDLSVGIDKIDDQHRKLIELINTLHAMIFDETQGNLQSILEELTAYVDYHFATEEVLMQKYNYPKFKEHKLQHEKFINELAAHIMKHTANELVEGDLFGFLTKWLLNHISKCDQEYAPFFKECDL